MLVCLFTSLTRRETGKAGNLAQLRANGDALTLHIAVLHLRWWTELQLEDAVVKVFVGLFLMQSKESSSSDFKMIIFLSLCFTPDFMKIYIYIYTCHNKYCIGIDFFCWHVERFQQVKHQPSSDWSKAVCVSWWILYSMKKKLCLKSRTPGIDLLLLTTHNNQCVCVFVLFFVPLCRAVLSNYSLNVWTKTFTTVTPQHLLSSFSFVFSFFSVSFSSDSLTCVRRRPSPSVLPCGLIMPCVEATLRFVFPSSLGMV